MNDLEALYQMSGYPWMLTLTTSASGSTGMLIFYGAEPPKPLKRGTTIWVRDNGEWVPERANKGSFPWWKSGAQWTVHFDRTSSVSYLYAPAYIRPSS